MAERNFDEGTEAEHPEGHQFTLGGYTFRTFGVAPPGAFLAGGRGLMAAVRFLRRVVIPEDRPALERVLEMNDATATLLDMAPELLATAALMLASEEGGDADDRRRAIDRLRDVVERAQTPDEPTGVLVSGVQVDEVAKWLMEETIGRPTKPSSPSSSGDGATSNGSKATSRAPAKAGKT